MVALPNAAPKKHDEPFGGVPLTLSIDSTISDGAKVTYAYLAAVTYALKPNALPPTRDEIARDRGISPSTVTNHVKELVRRDWLVAWHYVCRVGVINAYWAFESTDACRKYRADNPSLSYVTFDDEGRDISRPSRKGVGGNRKQVKRGTRSTQVDHPLDQLKLITPDTRSTQVDQGSVNRVDQPSAHSYKRESNTEINTDVDKSTSPTDVGQLSQNYDMVSNHIADPVKMVAAESTGDGVLEEAHKGTNPPVPTPPLKVRPTQPHIAPLLAWFNAVGDDIQPPDFELGRFTALGKTQAKAIEKQLLTLDQMEQAGRLYRAWFDNLYAPTGTMLAWDVGSVTLVMRKAVSAVREGRTADDIERVMKSLSNDKYLARKNVKFDRVLELVAENAQQPAQREPQFVWDEEGYHVIR